MQMVTSLAAVAAAPAATAPVVAATTAAALIATALVPTAAAVAALLAVGIGHRRRGRGSFHTRRGRAPAAAAEGGHVGAVLVHGVARGTRGERGRSFCGVLTGVMPTK